MKRLFLSIALLLAWAGTGLSAPIRYEFSGTIHDLRYENPWVSIGDYFSGFFVYDYDPLLRPFSEIDPGGPDSVFEDTLVPYGFQIGRSQPISISHRGNSNYILDSGSFVIYSDSATFDFGSVDDIFISLTDSTGVAFPTPALPTFLDVEKFDGGNFTVSLLPGNLGIYGTISQCAPVLDAPAPVPEPASVLLLGAGVAGLLLKRKKTAW